MADAESNLTPKQERAIVALLNEVTVAKAAEAAKVGERTIYDWMKEPAFMSALRRARREAFTQAVGIAQRYAPVALTHLMKIATDSATAANVRVNALTTIIKFGREGLELDDLVVRVEILEQSAKQDNSNQQGRGRAA